MAGTPFPQNAILDVRRGETGAYKEPFAGAERIISNMSGYRWHELQRCIR